MFVLPSLSEDFGIVLTEAMAHGLPIVVSNEVQGASHVTLAAAGRVVPLQVDTVADAMDELLGDRAASRAMGGRGRQYVRGHLVSH